MQSATRQHRVVDWSRTDHMKPPLARTERITVRVAGLAPIDALIARPEHPVGVTVHFVGFGIPMSDWERAKAALFADASNTIVVMCELPGFTRHGAELPVTIRQDLGQGDPLSLAEATWGCLEHAIRQATSRAGGRPASGLAAHDLDQLDGWRFDVMGYSTGCSLAVAVMPTIQTRYRVTRLTLVEPVALLRRSLPHLAVDNVTDLARIVRTIPGNLSDPWARRLLTQRRAGHGIHFSQADFWALVAMLAGDDTRARLDLATRSGAGPGRMAPATNQQNPSPAANHEPSQEEDRFHGTDPSNRPTWPPTDLVYGELSRLTSSVAVTGLDADLAGRGVPGMTCLVPRLGHQLWHSMPAVAALARTLHR
ncbi:MAG: hypothetical protein LBV00_06955 [Propionibacteriaceae bacterium]|nr:hypothetical protein [Propionibacteriaceae bacterium]